METVVKLVLLNLFISISLYAQDEQGSRVILGNEGFRNASYYVYSPVYIAKGIYKSINEMKNQYPEELMSSLLSETTQEWVNTNTLGGEKEAEKKDTKYFEAIRKMDKDKNYFELRCKLEYEANEEHFAIIKFYLNREGAEPMCGAYAMQRIENRWYKTSTYLTTSLAFMLMQFDENKLDLLFQQNANESPLIASLLNKILVNKQVSLSKLIDISNDWTATSDTTNTDFFLDRNSWINKK
jgi:hypothetical protein